MLLDLSTCLTVTYGNLISVKNSGGKTRFGSCLLKYSVKVISFSGTAGGDKRKRYHSLTWLISSMSKPLFVPSLSMQFNRISPAAKLFAADKQLNHIQIPPFSSSPDRALIPAVVLVSRDREIPFL